MWHLCWHQAPSSNPLFEFVGLQMAQIPDSGKAAKGKKAAMTSTSNTTHVAQQECSALPADDLDNEYLIVNYIVS